MRTIDADALTEVLETMAKDKWNQQVGSSKGLEDAIDVIENAPTVESERPKGYWNYIQAGMTLCPFCGASPHKDYKNFCPNCGADMRGDV